MQICVKFKVQNETERSTCVLLLRENMHQVVEMMVMLIVVVRLLWAGEISHIFADNNFRDKTQLLFELRGSVQWICDAKKLQTKCQCTSLKTASKWTEECVSIRKKQQKHTLAVPKKCDGSKKAPWSRKRIENGNCCIFPNKREKSAQRNENRQQIEKKLRRMYNENRIRRDEKMNVRSCEIYAKHLKHSSWIFWMWHSHRQIRWVCGANMEGKKSKYLLASPLHMEWKWMALSRGSDIHNSTNNSSQSGSSGTRNNWPNEEWANGPRE